jgi:GNAT superfamily N-acetyltransferase
MEKIITLNRSNIEQEHICCAISDKKCQEGYDLKKGWLKHAFEDGYVFRRLDARAKVFIEYGPAEKGWAPVDAPDHLLINCFWVSGRYKKQGYGKELLRLAWQDAIDQQKHGLATVVGSKKFHFMSDTKWLMRQGFHEADSTNSGFSLLTRKIVPDAMDPKFKTSAKLGEIETKDGLVAYYSNRCPFTEYHIHQSLVETAAKRKMPLEIIKLETMEEAQTAPSPATIFSLFYNGHFVTTDVSVCMDSRFDKILSKN